MSLEGFLPNIWSGQLLANLRPAHVYGNVANRNYEGEITEFGQTVKINQIGTITVSDYAPDATTITTQLLSDGQKELKIDQSKYFSFKVDSVRKVQMKPKVMAGAMREAAWSIRDVSDKYIASLYTDAGILTDLGTEGTGIEITSVNVTEYMGLLAQKLDEANVPMETRWVVVPPWFYQKLTLAKITLDTSNSEILSNGFKGNYLGFNVLVSNNCSVKTAATNQGSRIMAGYSGTITLAEQLTKVVPFEPEGGFSEAIKGLYVFGARTVRSDTLAVLRADYTVEP